jgi:hypothetical protein
MVKTGKDSLLKVFGNLNVKKWLLASIAVFVAMWLLDYLVHGVLLMKEYVINAKYFLPAAVMTARMPFMFTAQVLLSLLLVLLYSQGYTGKGSVTEGVRYGIYVGLLFNLPMSFSSYFMYAFPVKLLILWAVFGFLQFVIYGAIIGAMYKGK